MPNWLQAVLLSGIAIVWGVSFGRDVTKGTFKWRGSAPIHREDQPLLFWGSIAFWAAVTVFVASNAVYRATLAIQQMRR